MQQPWGRPTGDHPIDSLAGPAPRRRTGGGSPLLRALGLRNIGARLDARRVRREQPGQLRPAGGHLTGRDVNARPAAGRSPRAALSDGVGGATPGMVAAALTTSTGAWEVLAAPRREPRSVRLRRYAVILVGGVLVVTGGFTIAGQIRSWLVRPAPAAAAAQVVAESAFAGAAVPFAVDYLSWDDEDRPSRQAALARAVGPNTAVDGWAGSGRQWADSPAEVGFVRGDGDTAVVTVRVRIVPYLPVSGGAGRGGRAATPGTDPRDAGDAGVNVASGPVPDAAGWAAQQPRWLNLAVPVARLGERVVVTATPALVGSPPQSAAGPAVASSASNEDTTFAQATQTTLGRLLGAYGTGDLDYARAASTSFTGLSKAATLQKVVEWRVREPDPSDGDGIRVGDATVTWALSGAAGSLTCPYRVELHDDDGRWYLAAVGAELQEVN